MRHFRRKHFLCEHRDCKDNPLTSVFRSEFDLKVHIADKHGGIDKRDLRMEVGIGHKTASSRQQEIEEEIEAVSNQPLPNVQDQESFPSLGGKAGTPMSGAVKKTKAQTSYRSLSSQNINSTEDFPTLGGGAPLRPPNWNATAKTANKAGVSEFAVKSKKKKNKVNLSSQPSYTPQNPASAHVPSTSSNWSAEPDRFVEKSQLELQAEREAANRANQPKQKGPAKSDFPTLGGSSPAQQQFWGVPGASIAKSGKNGKKKKVISGAGSAPKVEFSNKKPKVTSPPPQKTKKTPLTIDAITASLAESTIEPEIKKGSNDSGSKSQFSHPL